MPRPAKPKTALRGAKPKPIPTSNGAPTRKTNRTDANRADANRADSNRAETGKQRLPRSGEPDHAGVQAVDKLPARPAHRWTFLTNHAHVLVLLKAQPELILREVATRVGITERAVQRIIQDLESAGFIQRQKVGRQNQYQVMTEQPLRHPIEAHRKIGDLLKLING